MITLFTWIFAITWTVFWGSASLVLSIFDPKGHMGFRCMKRWARGLLNAGGVRITARGFEKLASDRTYLFVSNHQSQVDIIALSAAIPQKFGWMAKKSLFKIPFLGWHMRKMGYVAVDRNSVKSATQGLLEASKTLKRGNSLLIFPEGSRSQDGKLKQFKDGAFYLAIEAGTPIVPLTVEGTKDIVKKGSIRIHKGEAAITALDIINVDNYNHSDRDKLKELVRGMIESNLASEQKS